MTTRGIVAVVAAAVLLTACTGGADDNAASTTGTPTGTTSTSPTGTGSGAAPAPATDVARSCGTPAKALVDRAKIAIASPPGPVTATTLVHAANTSTGKWSVIGLDRAYVHDDATLAGGSSRDLALVRVDEKSGSITMIEVASRRKVGPPAPAVTEDWSNVTWTADLLDQGKAAVAKAVECLDGQGAGD